MPKGADPVQWVRDNYCSEAIETKSQIAYIERITGRPSTCKPKEPVMSYDGTVSGGYDYGKPYGWESNKPSSYSPENDASRALATGQYGKGPGVRLRYCGQTTKGVLCPRYAKEGMNLCDVHYMESLPIEPPNTSTAPLPPAEGA